MGGPEKGSTALEAQTSGRKLIKGGMVDRSARCGWCARRARSSCSGWATCCSHTTARRASGPRAWCCRRAHAVIAPSGATARDLLCYYPDLAGKVSVIPLANRFSPPATLPEMPSPSTRRSFVLLVAALSLTAWSNSRSAQLHSMLKLFQMLGALLRLYNDRYRYIVFLLIFRVGYSRSHYRRRFWRCYGCRSSI